jgi:competence ComEA-like helix-hairpin-helix protein
MKTYVFLGGLFVALIAIGGVIIAKDGAYRDDLASTFSSNNNFEVIDEVSVSRKNSEPENIGLTASLIDSVKKELPEEITPENTSDNKSLPDSSREEPSIPDPEEIISPEQAVPNEVIEFPDRKLPSPKPVFPVDINTAGLERLQDITGVGPVIASRIIEDRTMRGPFYFIEDIRRVNGVGDATFEKMRYQITVGNVTPPAPPPPSPPSSPPKLEPIPSPAPVETTPASAKININTAGLEELQEITGVGPVISQRIIDYRTQNGPFQKTQDIKNVKGIGDATFEKMKGEITI